MAQDLSDLFSGEPVEITGSGVSLGYVPSVTRFDRPKARVRTTKTFFSEG